jgi:hypothetical protein
MNVTNAGITAAGFGSGLVLGADFIARNWRKAFQERKLSLEWESSASIYREQNHRARFASSRIRQNAGGKPPTRNLADAATEVLLNRTR